MIELSFVIPAYNVERYIERCLISIFSQDVDESRYEVIVIDDGSTDNTLQILNEHTAGHINLRIVLQQNQGPSVARNKGIELSNGRYIWFVDADDYILGGSIGKFLTEVQNEDFDVLCFPFKLIEPDGKSYVGTYPQSLMNSNMTGKNAVKNGYNKWAVWMAGWNKSYINSINLRFMPDVIRGEDSLFAYYAIMQSQKMRILDTPMYVYERKEGGLTTVDTPDYYRKQRLGDITIIKKLIDLSMAYQNQDKEISVMINMQLKKIQFGLIYSLYRNRKQYGKLGIIDEVVKQMKEERLYPIKPPFYSWKKAILSVLLNREFILTKSFWGYRV